MNPKIRIARITDAKIINQLLNTDPHLSMQGNKGDYNIEDTKEFIKSKINKVLVYEIDKKIVGVIIAQIWKTYCYLHLIVIDKNYRGKGIGTLLMNKIHEIAKERKIDCIESITEKENLKMQALFDKFDYKRGNEYISYIKEIKWQNI
jgi:ribosomal protein S18 acetylase RimI-like enzyme